MGLFQRFLSVWVVLAIAAGVILGGLAPRLFQALAGLEIAHVNLPVAILIWLMVKGDVFEHINLLSRVDFVMKGGVIYKQNGQAVESAL